MIVGRIFQAILSDRQNRSPKYADKMPFTCMACIEKVHGMVFLFVGMGMRGNFCSSYPCDCMTVGMRGLFCLAYPCCCYILGIWSLLSCNTHIDSIFWVFGRFFLVIPMLALYFGYLLTFSSAIPMSALGFGYLVAFSPAIPMSTLGFGHLLAFFVSYPHMPF